MATEPNKLCAACKQALPISQFFRNSRMADGYRSSCKPCVSAINRASVLRHHEKRKAEKREVYQANKHTPEYQAYVKAYQEATREQKRAYDRAYAKLNTVMINERAKAWTKRNPEKRRAISHNYAHKRRNWTVAGISSADLAEWTAAQKKVCYWCGTKCAKLFHIDHYVPLSKGGAHEAHNLVIACAPCNLKKNAKDPFDFAREKGRLL